MYSADARDASLCTLSKKARRALLDCCCLSGTDKCLLIVALCLLERGLPVDVLTLGINMRRVWRKVQAHMQASRLDEDGQQ